MRRAAAILLLSLLAAPALAAPGMYKADDRAELDRISAYLNSIKTMKGGFVQIDPNGDVDQGTFAISKPGRMRFEYKPPAPTLIVSDGRRVAVANSQLRTVDSYPLDQTPLDLILGDRIDLAGSHEIVGVARQQDSFIVKARSRGGRTQGNITLTFSEPELELRQWTVIDNQGLSTTVALRDVQTGIDIPVSLFILPDKNAFRQKQGD
jgi:outer membrane lipoprotein-sorting protein